MNNLITRKQIETLVENAKHQKDVINGVYELIFQENWDRLEQVGGFPICSNAFSEFMFNICIDFDQKHHPNVVAGGMWMNNGFSTIENDHIVDPDKDTFMVDMSKCEPIYRTEKEVT